VTLNVERHVIGIDILLHVNMKQPQNDLQILTQRRKKTPIMYVNVIILIYIDKAYINIKKLVPYLYLVIIVMAIAMAIAIAIAIS